MMPPLQSYSYSISPPFWSEWPKGYCCVVKLSNFAESKFSYSWMVVSLSDCSFWTSHSSSILSRMIWNAFGGTAEDDEAQLFLPWLRELKGCASASVLVSIGSPSTWSPSSSSLGRRTLIHAIVRAFIAGGVGMRLMSLGISTPFTRKSRMTGLGRISFSLEAALFHQQLWSRHEH